MGKKKHKRPDAHADLDKKTYLDELKTLQIGLVEMARWKNPRYALPPFLLRPDRVLTLAA